MKKNLINEINRISELMGGKPLLSEQAVPKFLKTLLNLGDDVIKKVIKSTDEVSDDVLRRAKAGQPLSDEAVELLLRNIDFDKFAKIIIDNQMMGSQYMDVIDMVIEQIKKNPDQLNVILAKVDSSIDKLPFLADGPDELIKSLKSETRDRIMREVSPESARVVDDIFADMLNDATTLMDDIPDEAISDKMRNTAKVNLEKYNQFITQAKKKGSSLQVFTEEQYQQVVNDLASSTRRMDPKVFEEFQKIYALNPGWWKSLSFGKKILYVSSLIGLGPTAAAVLIYGTKARFSNWGDVGYIRKLFGYASGDIEELTQSNIKDYIVKTFPVDEPSFNNEYVIYISDDKKTARVRGPKNFKVTLSDNKITAEEI